MRYPKLTDDEIVRLNDHKCPDCEANVYEGPQGGGSINFICGSERCGSRFNYSLSWERVSEIAPMREDGDSMPIEVSKIGPFR